MSANSPVETASGPSAQPLDYDMPGTDGRHFTNGQFGGRVPVAIVLGNLVSDTAHRDASVRAFDSSLHEFGRRRVQLLVGVDGDPSEVGAHLQVNVPLVDPSMIVSNLRIADDLQGRIVTLLLDSSGIMIDTVRSLPGTDVVAPVLVAIDLLIEQFPDRMAVLPPIAAAGSHEAERIGRADDETVPDGSAHLDPTDFAGVPD